MSGIKRYGMQAPLLAGSTGDSLSPGSSDNLFTDKVQGGVATTSSSTKTIVFDQAFNQPPAVIPSANTSTPDIVAQATNITSTGFTLNVYTGNTAVGAGNIPCSWMAFGQA